jgi:hypothetical protein
MSRANHDANRSCFYALISFERQAEGIPETSNNIIQKGLAFRCETSGSVGREPWLACALPAA